MMFSFTPIVKFVCYVIGAVFLLTILAEGMGFPLVQLLALHNPNSPIFYPTQIFTYMLAHDTKSFWHLFFNMMWFVTLGPQLENFLGSRKFGNFIIICGVGVGASWLLWNHFDGSGLAEGISPYSSLVGFSGVLFGILALCGMYFPENAMYFFGFPVKMKYLVMGFVAYNFFNLFKNSMGDTTSYISHLLGIVFAVAMYYIWPLLENRKR
jgi:membrane associated rhomboid family serine protease